MLKIKYIYCIYDTNLIFLFQKKLNSIHCLIMNIHNKREIQQIAINHSADIEYKDFMKM